MQPATTNTLAEAKETYVLAVNNLNSMKQTVAPYDAELEEQINAIREQHRAKYAEAYNTLDELKSTFADVDAFLREQIVAAYTPGGEKKIDDNLSVRVTKKLKYDQMKAVEWAETNAPVMIVKNVDKKAFEAMPTVTDLDFVETEETVSAVISGLPKPE